MNDIDRERLVRIEEGNKHILELLKAHIKDDEETFADHEKRLRKGETLRNWAIALFASGTAGLGSWWEFWR